MGFGFKDSGGSGYKGKSVAGPTAEDQRRIAEALKAGRLATEKQQAQQAQKSFEDRRQWDQKQWEQRQQDDQRAFENRQREDQQAYEARLQQERDQQA